MASSSLVFAPLTSWPFNSILEHRAFFYQIERLLGRVSSKSDHPWIFSSLPWPPTPKTIFAYLLSLNYIIMNPLAQFWDLRKCYYRWIAPTILALNLHSLVAWTTPLIDLLCSVSPLSREIIITLWGTQEDFLLLTPLAQIFLLLCSSFQKPK
jgi:hypothetical protein